MRKLAVSTIFNLVASIDTVKDFSLMKGMDLLPQNKKQTEVVNF